MHGPVDVRAHNERAWDRQVAGGNVWTVPVSPEQTAAARRGQLAIFLTPTRPVQREWFPPLANCDVLCLASGGGQQGPLLAAAGARVTVFDNSAQQLAQDKLVANRDGLALQTVQGDMRNLSDFANCSFDLIVHPVSNVFVPEVLPVWREAFRVLRPGGALLSGLQNPAWYLFDHDAALRTGELRAVFKLPYSDTDSLTAEQVRARIEAGDPLEFSHSLADLLGGQTSAGFVIAGFYEDWDRDGPGTSPANGYLPPYFATRAVKPG